MYVIETPRLYLRKIQYDDFSRICLILQNADVMYAWEHTFSDEEVLNWISENITRYERDGFSYWAVIHKQKNILIGLSGLLLEKVDEENYVGVGYIFNKEYWHKGYAIESAQASIDYAFNKLNISEVTAQIRPENLSSRKVAEKIGMVAKKEFIRHYKGKEMPHILYTIMKNK